MLQGSEISLASEVEVVSEVAGEAGRGGLLGADYSDSDHDNDSENQYF
jgi:hypothetical protein